MSHPGLCTTIHTCRISDSSDVEVFLDLGDQPLANQLIESPDVDEETYPLRLGFSSTSGLVQLMETVPKEKLFRNYVWVSGTASTTREYAEIFFQRALQALQALGLQPGQASIVEIASNDGTFLNPFHQRGIKVLGVDPAQNLAAEATARGIGTWPEFWDTKIAARIRQTRGAADFVFARNVVPHVSELHEVIQGMHDVLADNGLGIIEFHEAGRIVEEMHYDSIYHEHLCYFSLHAMEYLLRRHALHPYHIEFSPISGGSIVVQFTKSPRKPSPEYTAQIDREKKLGLTELATWKRFSERCGEHRAQTLALLSQFDSKRIVGFGASARSSTFLNYCNITPGHMRTVIDNNPRKQGLFTPGSHLPIVSFEEGLALDPAAIFLLAWNFADEVIAQCRQRGFKGAFIQPFPNQPKIIH